MIMYYIATDLRQYLLRAVSSYLLFYIYWKYCLTTA